MYCSAQFMVFWRFRSYDEKASVTDNIECISVLTCREKKEEHLFGSLMAGSALEIDSKEVGEMALLVKQFLY